MNNTDWTSIIWTVIGTFISVGASVYFFHHQINSLLVKIYDTVHNLSQQMQIFNDRSGVVTYEQGVEIVDMYLVNIEHSLRDNALSYFSGSYKEDLQDGNTPAIEASIDLDTDKIINSCRRQVMVFKLLEGETFKQFFEKLHPLNDGLICETKKQGIAYFTQEARNNESLQKLLDAHATMLHVAINSARKDIMAELENRYSVTKNNKSE